MLDESGVADFSMRRLAARLDVVPSALYWHFADRTELLAAVSARVLGEMTLPDPTLDWDRWLRALAADYRRTLHRHPRTVALIGLDLVTNSAAVFPLVEALLDAFHRG